MLSLNTSWFILGLVLGTGLAGLHCSTHQHELDPGGTLGRLAIAPASKNTQPAHVRLRRGMEVEGLVQSW